MNFELNGHCFQNKTASNFRAKTNMLTSFHAFKK